MERLPIKRERLLKGLGDIPLSPSNQSTIHRWEGPDNSLKPERLPAPLPNQHYGEIPEEVISAITPAGIKALKGFLHVHQRLLIICEEVLVKGKEGVSINDMDLLFSNPGRTLNYAQLDKLRAYKFLTFENDREKQIRDRLYYPTEPTILLYRNGLLSYTIPETLELLRSSSLRTQVRFIVEFSMNQGGDIKEVSFFYLFDEFSKRFGFDNAEEKFIRIARNGFIDNSEGFCHWSDKLRDRRMGREQLSEPLIQPSYEAVRLYKDGML